MAGIYIHIPFCRKKCFYCDFYKTTAVIHKPQYMVGLLVETERQANYLNGEKISTIYLGGGTPSILTYNDLELIFGKIYDFYPVDENVEITLEANPDDLSPAYLRDIKQLGINRLSIGIQSFSDAGLKRMNRRHTALQAVESVREAAFAGFDQISIDLIYGLPGLTLQQWEKNLKQAVKLPVNHISAYHLTYHEGTKFYEWLKSGQLRELSEDESIDQFEMLMDFLPDAGFEHYEISNFARDNAYSKHNCSYWDGSKYLGLGPSAHSYDGESRQWNISSLQKYIRAVENSEPAYEREILAPVNKLNDYLITRLRTKWGISMKDIDNQFGKPAADQVLKSAASFILTEKLQQKGDIISLTRSGIMISDEIMLALIF